MHHRRSLLVRSLSLSLLAIPLVMSGVQAQVESGTVAGSTTDGNYRAVGVDALRQASVFVGLRVRVDGKFSRIFGQDIRLKGLPDLPVEPASSAVRQLVNRLSESQENVRLYGRVKQGRRTAHLFELEGLRVLASDVDFYLQRKVAAIEAGDVETLWRESMAALELARRMGEGGARLETEAFDGLVRAVDIEALSVSESDFDGQVRLATRCLELRNLAASPEARRDQSQKALAHLRRAFRLAPEHDVLPPLFDRVGAVRRGPHWVLQDELFEQEGFVRVDGKWLDARQHTFNQIAEERAAYRAENFEILRQATTEAYRTSVERSAIMTGMNKHEVAVAWGFPDRVLRREVDDRTYDAWFYAERDHSVYFENGEVFKY